jgi:glutamate dehydrogenase (NAD(P)+)
MNEAPMIDEVKVADELGPAKVIVVQEPSINLHGILVIDNVAAGPAIGGLRMAHDVSVSECARLARAMTLKNAAAGLKHGGGKSVLFGDPKMPIADKENLIRAFAGAVEGEADYIFGPDMGTNERCMAWVKDEIGRAVGLPREIGGIPLDEIGATGWGVAQSVEVAASFIDLELSGATVAVQGFGAVGYHAARFLADRGAVLVAASDSRGTVYDANGIDPHVLAEIKKAGGAVADRDAGDKADREAILDIACDIWIPAARPDVVTIDNVSRLDVRIVAQGANIPVTAEAEGVLHEQGTLSIPDFIANAGGVICAAVEFAGGGQGAALEAISERVRFNTKETLYQSQERGTPPRDTAIGLAEERIRRAMSFRRWSIF